VLTIVLASVTFAVGGLMMKPADGFTKLMPSLGVAACFLLGAFMLSRAVRTEGLTVVYILGLGIESVAAAAFGIWLLGERPSAIQAAGLALVVLGLVAVRQG
jgi:multidrug transporter EmrE-like cation transporter